VPWSAVCRCTFMSSVTMSGTVQVLGARGCDVWDRTGNCLYGGDDFHGCDRTDEHGCDAACATLAIRVQADAMRAYDVELRHAECKQGSCRNVFRIADKCYVGHLRLGPKTYDCSLSDEQILAQVDAEAAAALSAPLGSMAHVCPPPSNWSSDQDAGP